MAYMFNARNHVPEQGGTKHPPGKWRAMISATAMKPAKDTPSNFMLVVTFKTEGGQIDKRYNVFNSSQKAVEIAEKELSALCYATGVMDVDFENGGIALVNAQCQIEVAAQSSGDYMEVKKVLDLNGNEPGAKAMPQGALMAAAAPMQQQPGGFPQQQPAGFAPQPTANGFNGGGNPPFPQQQPQPAPQQQQPQPFGANPPFPQQQPQQQQPAPQQQQPYNPPPSNGGFPQQQQPQPAFNGAGNQAPPPNAPWAPR